MSHYLEMNELVPTFRGYFVTRAGAAPGEARRDLLKIAGLAAFHANCHHLYLYLANRSEEASAQLPPVITTNGVMQTLDITTQ